MQWFLIPTINPEDTGGGVHPLPVMFLPDTFGNRELSHQNFCDFS